MRKPSLMGSSKYEHDPLGLDRDINNRRNFYKNIVDPMIKELVEFNQVTRNFIVDILMIKPDNFLLTYEGVDAYITMNWERLHE